MNVNVADKPCLLAPFMPEARPPCHRRRLPAESPSPSTPSPAGWPMPGSGASSMLRRSGTGAGRQSRQSARHQVCDSLPAVPRGPRLERASRLRCPPQGPGVRCRDAGQQGLPGTKSLAVRELSSRQGRAADLPLPGDGGSGPVAGFQERPLPLHHAVAFGVGRQFLLQVPAGRTVWLLGGTGGEPRILDDKANPVATDLKTGRVELTQAAERLVVLPQATRKSSSSVPARPRPEASGCSTRMAAPGEEARPRRRRQTRRASCVCCSRSGTSFRDDAGLLRELLSKK